MRNKFPGSCYRCGVWVNTGAGHFERFGAGWRVQHATCAISHRGTPDPAREALTEARDYRRASGTGKPAQRARRRIRDTIAAHFSVVEE